MNYKEAMELPSDIGCFPRFFSWISLPLRTTSKGFSSEKDRYIHKSNEITLELSTNEKTAKLPLGQVGRTVIAYLATKIVRPQFVQMKKELGYLSPDDKELMLRRFPSYKFYLPSLSDMTKDIMGNNGGKNMKTVYDQLRGFLLCSVYIAPSSQIQKIFPYIPERLFIFANEVKINNGIKKQNTENYVILTREGINFLLDTIPLVFNDYKQLSSPLEQDLYVYFTRKSYVYNKFDINYSAKGNSDKIKDYPNATFPENPKKIKLDNLVLQFFNIKRNDKNYKRAEEKIKEAYTNLTYKYEKLGDSVFLVKNNFYILGNNDLFNFSDVIIKVKEKKEKAIFLRALEKRRNQKPFVKKYLKDNQNKLSFIHTLNNYNEPYEVAI